VCGDLLGRTVYPTQPYPTLPYPYPVAHNGESSLWNQGHERGARSDQAIEGGGQGARYLATKGEEDNQASSAGHGRVGQVHHFQADANSI